MAFSPARQPTCHLLFCKTGRGVLLLFVAQLVSIVQSHTIYCSRLTFAYTYILRITAQLMTKCHRERMNVKKVRGAALYFTDCCCHLDTETVLM